MTVEQRREKPNEQFPVGMRVLAVDDDPICLRLLETLLRKCQYHVTTTSQAITALKMLRENKNKFDLVISDVYMPDMDGFKLLELVGLEMDLPVIMLSANGDTKLVMKGITHGACDYLLKPVRMEELQNIWQHVVRRKRLDIRDQSSNSQEKNSGERNGCVDINSDTDSKLSKKRKDQIMSDNDEQDENDSENEDPSAQKKPRVVWSVELHRKFVAAVNQLGLDKAVPKKILELMNVEKLTRENVASHLQKYRLYLKRISYVTDQQANMVAALGGSDSPHLRMNSVNFHNYGSAQFNNNAMRPSAPLGVVGRLNTPAGSGMHGLTPSNIVQFGGGQVPRSSITEGAKFQPSLLPVDQSRTVLQGMPTSLEFDRLQNDKGMIDDSRIFSIANFTDANNTVVSVSSSSLLSLPNSSLTMQGCSQERKNHETWGINSVFPHNPLDHNRHNSSWPTSVQSQPTVANSMENSRLNTECQLGVMCDNMMQNMSYKARGDYKLNSLAHADFLDGSTNSSVAAESAYPGAQMVNARSMGSVMHRNAGFGLMAHPGVDSMNLEHNQMFENPVGTATEFKQGQFMEQGKALGNYTGNGAGSLDDVVTALFKQDQDENIKEWRFAM